MQLECRLASRDPEIHKIGGDNKPPLRLNPVRTRILSNEGALIVKTMEERIASAEQNLRVLKERHQKAEAKRKRDEAQQEKENDARRRVLAGTMVLEKVERGEIAEAQFRKWLDSAVTDPKDRALFNL